MIVRQNPESGIDTAEQAYFDSDAPSNDAAIREIDSEARRYGLVRVNEYWLQTRRAASGAVLRRGFCYRPDPAATLDRFDARRDVEPIGPSAAELVRQERDA